MIHTIIPYIYLTIGGFFFLYFIVLWIYCGRIPSFGWFWPLGGIVMEILGLFTRDYSRITPDGMTVVIFDERTAALREFCIQRLPIILFILAAVYLVAVLILSAQGKRKPSPGADYLIILGAHVNGFVPSKALMSRIMAAYDYLKDNPLTKAVLTGGKGRGENITEASCMKQELVKLGISESRLLLEEKSTTTKENIAFASEIIHHVCMKNSNLHGHGVIDGKNNRYDISFIIVTNDFHALRGKVTGKNAGYKRVETIGAPSSKIMKLHYYTREILSWLKLIILMLTKKMINK